MEPKACRTMLGKDSATEPFILPEEPVGSHLNKILHTFYQFPSIVFFLLYYEQGGDCEFNIPRTKYFLCLAVKNDLNFLWMNDKNNHSCMVIPNFIFK